KGALDLPAQVGGIVRKIDGCGRAVILADCVDCGGIAEAAQVLPKSRRSNPVGNGLPKSMPSQPEQSRCEEIFGAVAQQRLRKRCRLNHQKPVIKNCGELLS